MITIEEALSIILAHIKPLRGGSFELADCLDRVLAQDITARYNIPPFANSAMDGFAVRAADTTGGVARATGLPLSIGRSPGRQYFGPGSWTWRSDSDHDRCRSSRRG